MPAEAEAEPSLSVSELQLRVNELADQLRSKREECEEGLQREAAMALGATKWEMIADAVVPYARSGIVGGIILGLGRALGETMAVTMLIGNVHKISASLFAPGYTMASLIANEFAEATGDLHISALMAVGAVLFVVTLIVNGLARWLVWRVSRETRS